MQLLLINAVDCFALCLSFYLLVIFRDHRRRGGFLYPPGPPSRLIIGNLLDVPMSAFWIAYADMSKKYGGCNITGSRTCSSRNQHFKAILSVFAFFSGRRRVVFLNCHKDLLEKRGETYSDRPSLPIAEMYDLNFCFSTSRHVDASNSRMEMDWPIFMTRMSGTWRDGRKILDPSLRPGAAMSYRQIMQEKTREFLAQLFATPKDFRAHIEL